MYINFFPLVECISFFTNYDFTNVVDIEGDRDEEKKTRFRKKVGVEKKTKTKSLFKSWR